MLAEVIRTAAIRFADRPAIVSPAGWSCSYRQLDEASDRVALWLAPRWKIGPGSVVALILPSSADYVVIYGAIAKLGAITAGVNPHLTERERRAVLEVAQPDLVVAGVGLADGAPEGTPVIELSLAENADAVGRQFGDADGRLTPLPPDPDRPVVICFTSGTTGEPKGAVFTERELRAIAELDTGGAWGGGVPSGSRSTSRV